jgi:hypothetical protein
MHHRETTMPNVHSTLFSKWNCLEIKFTERAHPVARSIVTPVMEAVPLIALDLPLKSLVWDDPLR